MRKSEREQDSMSEDLGWNKPFHFLSLSKPNDLEPQLPPLKNKDKH